MVAETPGPKFLTSRPSIGGAFKPVSPILVRGSGRSDLERITKRRPDAGGRFVVTSNRSDVFCCLGRALTKAAPASPITTATAYAGRIYFVGWGVILIAGPRSSLCGMNGPSAKRNFTM